jgi:hypothetical protein
MQNVLTLKLIEGERLALEKALVECLFTRDMQKLEQLKQLLEAISQDSNTTLVHKSPGKTDF